jgi:hypothetical protein
MGYQFSNNWPYDWSVFPSMDEHTDPVNNEYFTGLHTEVENIEETLGKSPQGSYDTVADRLDDIQEGVGLSNSYFIQDQSATGGVIDPGDEFLIWSLEISLPEAKKIFVQLNGQLKTTSPDSIHVRLYDDTDLISYQRIDAEVEEQGSSLSYAGERPSGTRYLRVKLYNSSLSQQTAHLAGKTWAVLVF